MIRPSEEKFDNPITHSNTFSNSESSTRKDSSEKGNLNLEGKESLDNPHAKRQDRSIEEKKSKKQAEYQEEKDEQREGEESQENSEDENEGEDDWEEISSEGDYIFEEEEEYKEEILEEDQNKPEGEFPRKFSDLKFSDEPVVLLDDDEVEEDELRKKKKKKQEKKLFDKINNNPDFLQREYDLFSRDKTPLPCLTLDVLIPSHKKDAISVPIRQDIKSTLDPLYLVAGSQSVKKTKNALYIMKWSNLHQIRPRSEILSIQEDSRLYREPKLDFLSLSHPEAINRIKSMNNTGIVALWDESGKVSIYDTTRHIRNLVEYNEAEEEIEDDEGPNFTSQGVQPPKDASGKNFLVESFQHSSEGFAIQWSPLTLGLMATGNKHQRVYLYRPTDEMGAGWTMDYMPSIMHHGSVEDIEFSPVDPNLLASCSVDGTIKFLDMREWARNECAASISASQTDVNVISWCAKSPEKIASGSDDGAIKIWDIRQLQNARPLEETNFHEKWITSIQFHPHEDSILTAASGDQKISVWDFSGKRDGKQPLFVHQGLAEAKEISHHPSVSDLLFGTGEDGFHVFKPNLQKRFV